jgi:hypothetical protein
MSVQVWVMAVALVIFVGIIAYAMTRRYGWGAALALPILALVVMIAMRWQDEGLTVGEGLRMAGSTLLFAVPVLLGFFAGMAAAWFRRG